MTVFYFIFGFCQLFFDRQAGDDKSNSNGKTDNCGEKSEFVNEKTVC